MGGLYSKITQLGFSESNGLLLFENREKWGFLSPDSSLDALIEKELVHKPNATRGVALNLKRKGEIESYL